MSVGGGASLGTATFYITGNAQGATNAATQANNALAQMGQVVANNWWGIQNLGRAFAALPAAVGVGIGAAVKAAISWEDSMFALQRTTGESDARVKEIGDSILEVARRIPLATSELADLAAQGAQLGIANTQLDEFASTMGTLISATNLTQANVGDFARVLNVLNVPSEQWDEFANNLLEVGRNTAATESEILNMSRRLAATGAQVGATSSDVLGLSAAVLSLGPRAEAGASALQKVIFDMQRAISAGGDDLETFAKVAGMSGEEFRRAFGEDAFGAVASFVTGLDKLKGGGATTIAVLDELGISEVRQAQALLALAAGTRNVGSEQTDLNTILAKSAQYGSTNQALLDIQAAKAKTLSGQIQLLRNAMFELGTVVGAVLVGPLGFMIQRFIDFTTGLQVIPAPLRFLIIGLGLLLTAFSALAAAVFLVGPRLFIAADAFQRLRAGASGLSPEVAGLGMAMNATAGAAGRMNGQLALASRTAIGAATNMRAAQVAAAGNYAAINANIARMAGTVATSSAAAVTGVTRLTRAVTLLGKAALWITIALTALSVVTGILGNRQRAQAEAAAAALGPNAALVSIMRQQGASVGPASLEWIHASEKYLIAAAAAKQLGINLLILDAIITGQATPQNMDDFITAVKNGGEAGKVMGRNVLELGKIFQNSASSAGVAASSVEDFSEAQEESAAATEKNTEALQKQHDLTSQMAQGFLDLADAVVAQYDAQKALAEAQEAYAQASKDAANPAERIRDAELALADARDTHAEALRTLEEREEDLSEARETGLKNLRLAELDLLDAQDRYEDSLESIVDLEEELAELRSGGSADELRDATNDLRDAELRLARAHQTVADAEWYLQHLREEGASDRDIAEAEFAIAEAQHETAEAQDELIDATEELADLRDPTRQAERIADLEEDIAQAYRDSERAALELQSREDALRDARDRVATDRDYLDAQDAIVDAHRAVRSALNDVRDAERELSDLRSGGLYEEVEEAARDLEAAILDMAKANVEVLKQQTLANGGTWDAGRAARALQGELQKLISLAPDAAAQARLQNYIDTIRNAPAVSLAPGSGAGGAGDFSFDPHAFGLPTVGEFGSFLDELEGELDGFGEGGDTRSFWDKFQDGWDVIVNWMRDELPKKILGASQALWDTLYGIGEDIIDGLWTGFSEAWKESVFVDIWQWFHRNFLAPILRGFGIGSPSKVMAQLGKDIVQGLLNGVLGLAPALFAWFIGLPGKLLGFIINLPGTFLDMGGKIIGGLKSGAETGWNVAKGFFGGLANAIPDQIKNPGGILNLTGAKVIRGLNDGWLYEWTTTAAPWLAGTGKRAKDAIASPEQILKEKGKLIMIGLQKGMTEQGQLVVDAVRRVTNAIVNAFDIFSFGSPSKLTTQWGKWIMMGLENGIIDQQKSLEQTIAETAGLIEDGLARDYVASLMTDPSIGRAAFATSAAGMAASNGGASVTYNENLNLEAITTADPTEIVNEYVWQKRIRARGGVR